MKARVKETKEQNTTMPKGADNQSCAESNAVPEQTETTAEAAKGVQRDVPSAPESLTQWDRRYFWSAICFSRLAHKKYEGTYFAPRTPPVFWFAEKGQRQQGGGYRWVISLDFHR